MQKDLLFIFGQTIRKIRLSKGISQEKLADMCDLHRTYISDIELGKRNVSLENIEKMANALDMKISELFQELESNASI
ncbi:MAG TPA: helix-turn-helix transcriptional regulator [Clostridia bacterium]|jgi:transcriptional regulator with XRE-family HTH domain|nr:helix-turn-helix transcriptional regulator [Clostridia bacterium]HQA96584.1 helix-turn-helix transcriptional regulator [Clostridia bacterium]HQO54731.1 helix-turn-helix transcriptional regulator [Clostridia bacterium]HUM60091.1 helix-turn-helix transcriptional regulator [Clostridia bacterium]